MRRVSTGLDAAWLRKKAERLPWLAAASSNPTADFPAQRWGGVGLAEGWTVFGIVLVAGGLAIDPGDVPVGFGPASHGGLATVEVVPLGCDVPPDATVELEEVGTPLALEPVLLVLLGEVEVVEVPEAVVLPLAGVHGATVGVVPLGVVPLGFWVAVVPVVPPVTAPGLPATAGVPCVGAGAPVALVPGCEAGVPVVGCVVVVVPG